MATKTIARLFTCVIAAPIAANAGFNLNFYLPQPPNYISANTPPVNNSALGVSNYIIEDFSSTKLISGLTITLSGGTFTPSPTTWTALPALYNQNNLPSDCYTFGDGIVNLGIASWTGPDAQGSPTPAYAVVNLVGNQQNSTSCRTAVDTAQVIGFNYAPGATSFGIGLANFQSAGSPAFPITNHELFINGFDMGVLETLAGANWSPGIVLNAYLRIDSTDGDVITSVAFQNNTSVDTIGFSDVAVQPAAAADTDGPIPLWALCALGAGLVAIASRRITKAA